MSLVVYMNYYSQKDSGVHVCTGQFSPSPVGATRDKWRQPIGCQDFKRWNPEALWCSLHPGPFIQAESDVG